MASQQHIIKYVKILIFLLALIPFGLLTARAFSGTLGANPVETITHATGQWSLRFLLLTLAITPLRQLTGWNSVQRGRRMLGLFAFFYACLHVLTFLVFDHFFNWSAIFEDIVKRPYITLGFLAFVLLIPLAGTSTKRMMQRLKRNWQRLHRLVYPAGGLAVAHFLWLVKADLLEPMIYLSVLLVLLGYRVWRYWQKRAKTEHAVTITLPNER